MSENEKKKSKAGNIRSIVFTIFAKGYTYTIYIYIYNDSQNVFIKVNKQMHSLCFSGRIIVLTCVQIKGRRFLSERPKHIL